MLLLNCLHAQVQGEVQGFLKMLNEVYTTFGLEYSIALSTRPEDFMVSKKRKKRV